MSEELLTTLTVRSAQTAESAGKRELPAAIGGETLRQLGLRTGDEGTARRQGGALGLPGV